MRPPTPWSNKHAVGHDDAAAPVRTLRKASHDQLEEQPRCLSRAHPCREVGRNVSLFLAAERRISQNDVDLLAAHLGHRMGQRVAAHDVGPVDLVQQHVHLAQQERHRLLLEAPQLFLDAAQLRPGLGLGAHVLEGPDQEPAGPDRRVEHRLAHLRVDALNDEPHQRTRGVELAGIACRVTHLTKHRLVEVGHRVDVIGRREVHLVDLVHQVTQQVSPTASGSGSHGRSSRGCHAGRRVCHCPATWPGRAGACRRRTWSVHRRCVET